MTKNHSGNQTKFSEYNTIEVSRFLAIFSFTLGTLLFMFFLLLKEPILMFIGLFYVPIAIIVNLILVASIIFKKLKKYIEKKEAMISVGILLLNIPIIYLYFKLSIPIIELWFD